MLYIWPKYIKSPVKNLAVDHASCGRSKIEPAGSSSGIGVGKNGQGVFSVHSRIDSKELAVPGGVGNKDRQKEWIRLRFFIFIPGALK